MLYFFFPVFSDFYITLFDFFFFFTLTKYLLKRETPLRWVPAEGEKPISASLDWARAFPCRWFRSRGGWREQRCLWDGEIPARPGNSGGAFPVAAAPSPGGSGERPAGADPWESLCGARSRGIDRARNSWTAPERPLLGTAAGSEQRQSGSRWKVTAESVSNLNHRQ